MFLTKKILIAIIFGCAIASAPTTIFAAGKIENPTLEEVNASLDNTIERAEKTMDALENGADQETILSLLNDTKQMSKEIHATRAAAVLKNKAASEMKKARIAAKKNDLATAKKHVVAGVEFYHQLKNAFMKN